VTSTHCLFAEYTYYHIALSHLGEHAKNSHQPLQGGVLQTAVVLSV